MKKIVLIIFALIPMLATAQRMELYTYNSSTFIALYAYGLPREVVKTNDEMKASQMNGDGTGVVKRHHTTKGLDERIGDDGYNANDKISFAFIIAPYNIDINGEHTSSGETTLTWSEASGWDTSMDSQYASEDYDTTTGIGTGESILADTPTGCAAYKGINGKDKPGDWRLPTQREIQVMFTVIEQSLDYIVSGDVTHEIISGNYWSATEFYDYGSKAWSISSITGRPSYDSKSLTHMARCVKDIYETINE